MGGAASVPEPGELPETARKAFGLRMRVLNLG